jgi:hypothetical protein
MGLRGKIYQSVMCFVRPPTSNAAHARNAITRLAQNHMMEAATISLIKLSGLYRFVEQQEGRSVGGGSCDAYMFQILFLVLP